MHSKRLYGVTEHSKINKIQKEHMPQPFGRSQGSRYSSLNSSATATHWAHSDSIAQERDESSIPASIGSTFTKTLRRSHAAAPGIPCPSTRVPLCRALRWGLCCAGGEGTDRRSLSSAAAVPLYSRKARAHASGCSCAKEGALWSSAVVTLPLSRIVARSRSVLGGEGAAAAAAVQGMKAPACRELPQHPCDDIYRTRGSTRLSRRCLNWPRYQGTPGWPPISSTQPDTSATTAGDGSLHGAGTAHLLRGAVQATAATYFKDW